MVCEDEGAEKAPASVGVGCQNKGLGHLAVWGGIQKEDRLHLEVKAKTFLKSEKMKVQIQDR